ncbi:amino acid transporter, putative [Plasmodium gallinaceum]|uniref:Amino acid transporter, putative n=1 Tax=Plasmodium gallinaceum TaxID=5849 RepID=A0A1J1GYK5_PLAGA|nr:amino acid transporter, putative [Plasmodium gallinaceum]CRG96376.1 amino acid transporter, putative [Plasmodium gallinaceum]
MFKKYYLEKYESGAKENDFIERKKKKLRKLNSPHFKQPNDLKTCLYNTCINFSNSDIYQEYISRFNLNSYNNCDYDQIRRNSFISKEKFLKYYNFNYYNKKFELESEVDFNEEFFEDLNDNSDIEEIGNYMIKKYKNKTEKQVKNLLLLKREYDNIKSIKNVEENNKSIEKQNNKEVSSKKKNSDFHSKSYTSKLLSIINHETLNNNFDELLKTNIKKEESCYRRNHRKHFFLNLFRDSEESSFASNFNVSFLNYCDINKRKIKNSGNEDYLYMLNNLAESQNDPFIEKYYKDIIKMLVKRNLNKSKKEKVKYKEEIYGQMKSENKIEKTKNTSILKNYKIIKEEKNDEQLKTKKKSERLIIEKIKGGKSKSNDKKDEALKSEEQKDELLKKKERKDEQLKYEEKRNKRKGERLRSKEKRGEQLKSEQQKDEKLKDEKKGEKRKGERLRSKEKRGEPLKSEQQKGEQLKDEKKGEILRSKEKRGEPLKSEQQKDEQLKDEKKGEILRSKEMKGNQLKNKKKNEKIEILKSKDRKGGQRKDKLLKIENNKDNMHIREEEKCERLIVGEINTNYSDTVNKKKIKESNILKYDIRKSMESLSSEEMNIYLKKILKNENIKFNQRRIDNRDRWNSISQFICACIGASLSVHCYLDIPELKSESNIILISILFLFCYLFIGWPLLQLEFALGQISQSCIVNSLSLLKKTFRGIGLISLMISFYVLSKNINNSVDTFIIVTNTIWKPLPWNLKECEKIFDKTKCIKNNKCKWVTYNDTTNNIFNRKKNLNMNMNNSYKKEKNDNNLFTRNNDQTCVSSGILEVINFFSEKIKFVWKLGSLFFIILIIYFLLRIEDMSLNQSLHYSFLFFFMVVFFQIFILYYELHPKNMKNIFIKYNENILFSKDYFLYINSPLIAKIITIVLVSINCSTGLNYMFSSYTNIGENIFFPTFYVIFGSYIGILMYLVYYYLCIESINNYPFIYDKLELNTLFDNFRLLPINYSSIQEFLKRKYSINHYIIYVVALSRIKFPNIMSFVFFLSCILVIITSSAVYLKGVILILKESRKFKILKKKTISLFIITIYFFLGFFNLFNIGYNINFLINFIISSYIYLFITILQIICITWIYGCEHIGKIINHKKLYFYFSLNFFITISVIPIILYICKHFVQNIFFFILLFLFLFIVFISINAILFYSIKGDVALKEKMYFLYIFNIDILRRKLNNILYGKRRTYDLHIKQFHCVLFKKFTLIWCYLMKYFIPFVLIFIFLTNLLYHIHFFIHIGSHNSGSSSYYKSLNKVNRHSYLRVATNKNMSLNSKWKKEIGFNDTNVTYKNNNFNIINLYNNLKENTVINNYNIGENELYINLGTKNDNKDIIIRKNESKYFSLYIYFSVTIILLLFVTIIASISFIQPCRLRSFICPPTHTWNISDIHYKKKNPMNFLYTRYIFFFEEILPIENIMPFYIWNHIKKHIKNESFINSLHKDNENNETIYDKKLTYLNKFDYENYIFKLIDHGSKLYDLNEMRNANF